MNGTHVVYIGGYISKIILLSHFVYEHLFSIIICLFIYYLFVYLFIYLFILFIYFDFERETIWYRFSVFEFSCIYK